MAIEPDNYILHGYAQHNMLQAQPDHRILQYNQSRATLSATNFWGTPGVSPYAASPYAASPYAASLYAANNVDDSFTLDSLLRGNNFRGSNQSLHCYQQLLRASPLANQYVGSSPQLTNMPAQGANNVTGGIYYPTRRGVGRFANLPQAPYMLRRTHTQSQRTKTP